MARFDLTDFEWSVIQPVLPQKSPGGRVDDRRVLNGIFWRLRTGAPWADIPARYGPHTTCVNRFNRMRKLLADQGVIAVIASMPQRNPRLDYNREIYKERNFIERLFNKIKQFRAVTTRYDKRNDNFLATVQLASLRIWLRSYESMT